MSNRLDKLTHGERMLISRQAQCRAFLPLPRPSSARRPIAFSVGGLAGYQMLGDDKSLATAPLTGFNIGVALGAIVVAIRRRLSRPPYQLHDRRSLMAIGGADCGHCAVPVRFLAVCLRSLADPGCPAASPRRSVLPPPMPRRPSTRARRFPGFWRPASSRPCSVRRSPSGRKDMFAPILFAGAFLAFMPTGASGRLVVLLPLKLPDR